jgi:hypothetical protein
MSKVLIGIFFVLVSFTGLQAEQNLEAQGKYIQPCTSWTYEWDVNGYVCRFYDRLEVATSADVRNLEYDMDQLERKVQDLEARVKRLEDGR